MPQSRNRYFNALIAVGLICASTASFAAEYPDRAIRMVVGFPAGQSTDTSARRIAQAMTESLKQSVYVDNKPGAAGAISHDTVKSATPDGYTLLMGSTGTLAINPFLYKNLSYDPVRDFEPVALVSASPLVLFTKADSQLNDLADLIAYSKAHPGALTYGSSGNGTTGHIAMEMLKKSASIELLHVPYKGSPPMLTDVIGGQVDVAFDTTGSVMPMVKNGRVKVLGVATTQRLPETPELPTLAEQGLPGFQAVPWSAIVAPKGTPAAVIATLNAAVNQALKAPDVIEQLSATGSHALGGTSADFQAYLQKEHATWGQAVIESGAQID